MKGLRSPEGGNAAELQKKDQTLRAQPPAEWQENLATHHIASEDQGGIIDSLVVT